MLTRILALTNQLASGFFMMHSIMAPSIVRILLGQDFFNCDTIFECFISRFLLQTVN
jgi:hypothetical protein